MDKKLKKAWEKTVTQVFLSKNNACFLSSVLTSVKVHWISEPDHIAYVAGLDLYINQDVFLEITEQDRLFLLLHELWHLARLHIIRLGNRDPELWNLACDTVINNTLLKQGYSTTLKDKIYKKHFNDNLSEEEIYDLILKENPNKNKLKSYTPYLDLGKEPVKANVDKSTENKIINTVLKATKQSQLIEGSESLCKVEEFLNKFLKPKVNWITILQKYLDDLSEEEEITWYRKNRRFENIYLPGKVRDTNRLKHVTFFLDTSGSISQKDIDRFNSEVSYVHSTYKPELLTVVQFDTSIVDEKVFTSDDDFNKITVKGRGGTSLAPVREYLIKNKPQVAIIFSDLYVEPMSKLPFKLPIVWVCNSDKKEVPFGKLINIEPEGE